MLFDSDTVCTSRLLLLQVQWFPNGEQLVTSSADKSVRCWDAEAGMQIKRLSEHISIVNSINPLQRGPALFVSGGDDAKIKVRIAAAARPVESGLTAGISGFAA